MSDDTECEPTDETPLSASTPRDFPPKYKFVSGIDKMKHNIEDAKEKSTTRLKYHLKLCEIISESVAYLVCLLIFQAIPIAMIVIGSIYLHDCPGQRFIPIWLIVFGCFSVLQSLITISRKITTCFKPKKNEGGGIIQYGSHCEGCCECLIALFLFAWFIVGSVWVLGYFNDFHSLICQEHPTQCCSLVPYWFSFMVIVMLFTVVFVSAVLCIPTIIIMTCIYESE